MSELVIPGFHLPSHEEYEAFPELDLSLASIESIRDVAGKSKTTRFFFAPDTMRFFKSRVSDKVFPTYGEFGTLFITSERFDSTTPRMYSIRMARYEDYGSDNPTFEILTEEFQAYASLSGAKARAQKWADALMHPRIKARRLGYKFPYELE